MQKKKQLPNKIIPELLPDEANNMWTKLSKSISTDSIMSQVLLENAELWKKAADLTKESRTDACKITMSQTCHQMRLDVLAY